MINSRADLTHYGLNATPTEKPATIGAVPTEHAFRQAASRSNQPNSAAMLAAVSSQLAAARSQAGRLWLRARRSEARGGTSTAAQRGAQSWSTAAQRGAQSWSTAA